MKRLLFFSLFLMMAMLSFAHDFEAGGIYYNITSSSAPYMVEVTYQGTDSSQYGNEYSGAVSIPSSVVYNGITYKVAGIGYEAFRNCTGLTSVTIPNSVTSIGANAFYGTAWYDNQPNGLLYIGKVAYKYKGTMPSNTKIVLKEGTLVISDIAFSGCSGLTSITIPNSVTSIGSSAFKNCSGLTSITIPNSVTSIGANAFYGTAWYDNQPNGLVYAGKVAYKYKGTMPKNTVIDLEEGTTGIAGNAFNNCSGLTSITIPNSVTSIGDDAFMNCSSLTSITIPNGVTSFGSYAFYGCSGLTSITIPNSVTSISYCAFYGCSGLTSITIPNGVTSIGSYAFYNCSGLTSITIPNSVTSIGWSAFYGCSGLTSITIPNSVTEISREAFSGCSGLTSIIIPNSVTTIGDKAFSGCYGLTSVTIPNSVTSIGDKAFSGCGNLVSVEINSNAILSKSYTSSSSLFGNQVQNYVIGNDVRSIGDYAFHNTKLKSVTIGAGVLSISYTAFSYSDSSTGEEPVKVIWLTNTPPSGWESVGGKVNYVANDLYKGLSNMTVYPFLSSMFEVGGVKYVPVSPSERTCDAIDCTYDAAAENINIGKTVSYKGIAMTVNNIKPYTCYQNTFIKSADVSCNGSIGDYAFYGCGSLNNVTLSNNRGIGDYAFSGNTSLEKAILGGKVTSLGDYVFDGCSSLQSIDIPNGITQMGSYAFSQCSNMTSAKIGTGVTAINEYTFSGCSALKDVQIGSNVRTIGNYVFSGCTSLPVINIPKAVTSIGNNTFSGCTALREVVMEDRADDTVLSLGSNGSSPMFASCPLDKVYIGRNISYNKTSNYGYSPFYRNTSLRSVTITDRETEVSENEFYGCTNLKEVKIGDGVTTIGSWAFSGCAAIDYFAFGSSVKTIGQEAFSDCTAMTRLISRAATPPSCGSQALDDINKWTCTLSVPAGSTSAYQAAAQWKEFFFIDNDMTGIETVAAESVSNADITAIYDLNGRRRNALQPGINIVKMSDGTTKKVLAK